MGLLMLMGDSGFSIVNAAQSVTPTTELWTRRSATNVVTIGVPFNANQCYYYDIYPIVGAPMVLNNVARYAYTRPGGLFAFGAQQLNIKQGSFVEGAIAIRKTGTADQFFFVPDHSATAICQLTSRTITRDGVTLTGTDAAHVSCSEFVINQLFSCVHPSQGSPLANLSYSHTITAQKISCTTTIDFLDNCDISTGYSVMNDIISSPVEAAVFSGSNRSLQSFSAGNVAAASQGLVTGVAMRGTGNSSVLLCDWSSNLSNVLASKRYIDPSLYQWFAGTRKYYNQPFSNVSVTAGQTFSWSANWRAAEWPELFA